MNKKEKNNKGFSLVELIIVIAIMAILVGVLAPQFIKYVESSRQSTDIQNCSEIRAAVEAYVAENQPTGKIVVNATSTSISVGGSGVSAALSEVGLSENISTKSSGWSGSPVAEYDCSTFRWSTPASVSNTKEPGKDLTSAFK